MQSAKQSAGSSIEAGTAGGDSSATATTSSTTNVVPFPALAQRSGATTIGELIEFYMRVYAGRDHTRVQRLSFWKAALGSVALTALHGNGDPIHFALEDLSTKRGRFYCGKDASGVPIYKAKKKPLANATINRYEASLGAVVTWAQRKRITPIGWINPMEQIEAKSEHNERVRFLSDDELPALLAACKRQVWPKLYLLVLLALTTGARRGELERLRWRDIDFERNVATLGTTKNGDPRLLVLVPNVVQELRRFKGQTDELLFGSTRRPDVPHNHVPTWHKALREAGIKNFRFHDLRHTCASYLAMSGATLTEVADVLGHRNISVTKRYSHLSTGHKAALVAKVLGGIK